MDPARRSIARLSRDRTRSPPFAAVRLPYRFNEFCPPPTVLDPRQAMKEIIGRGMGV